MEMVQSGYRGLRLVFDLNWDRLLYIAMVATALAAGAFIGSLL